MKGQRLEAFFSEAAPNVARMILPKNPQGSRTAREARYSEALIGWIDSLPG